MNRIATFRIDDRLRQIVEHATNAPTIRPNGNEMCDPDNLKPGVTPAGFPGEDDIDLAKIPRGLWLVKDNGIYLMSPGNPPLLDDAFIAANPDSTRHLCAYAVETPADGEDSYLAARRIAGGDDFCEKLEIGLFQQVIADGAKELMIEFSDDAMSVMSR
ncbi:DUF3085 domain-containing protein [Sphingosinicella sp. BN140058]|uniref:DUF3085 domain-containing protein n=1 Tax=Sphingosinicella sp. BN140058 TaxID=1892855 RepID=UPI00101342C6|nr:DUF3085 domain-containing protein [Sphingosinicella sp. BN140058]QAY80172.1 DUF3085 domain-containing protein [Sphingosinicella sp. BN140058]